MASSPPAPAPASAYLDRVAHVVPTKKQIGHAAWAEAWPTVHDPPEETRAEKIARLKVRAANNEQWTGLTVSPASESAEIDDPNVIASSRSLDHLQHVQDIATKTQVKSENGKCIKIPHNRWRARMLSVVSTGTERTLNGERVLPLLLMGRMVRPGCVPGNPDDDNDGLQYLLTYEYVQTSMALFTDPALVEVFFEGCEPSHRTWVERALTYYLVHAKNKTDLRLDIKHDTLATMERAAELPQNLPQLVYRPTQAARIKAHPHLKNLPPPPRTCQQWFSATPDLHGSPASRCNFTALWLREHQRNKHKLLPPFAAVLQAALNGGEDASTAIAVVPDESTAPYRPRTTAATAAPAPAAPAPAPAAPAPAPAPAAPAPAPAPAAAAAVVRGPTPPFPRAETDVALPPYLEVEILGGTPLPSCRRMLVSIKNIPPDAAVSIQHQAAGEATITFAENAEYMAEDAGRVAFQCTRATRPTVDANTAKLLNRVASQTVTVNDGRTFRTITLQADVCHEQMASGGRGDMLPVQDILEPGTDRRVMFQARFVVYDDVTAVCEAAQQDYLDMMLSFREAAAQAVRRGVQTQAAMQRQLVQVIEQAVGAPARKRARDAAAEADSDAEPDDEASAPAACAAGRKRARTDAAAEDGGAARSSNEHEFPPLARELMDGFDNYQNLRESGQPVVVRPN